VPTLAPINLVLAALLAGTFAIVHSYGMAIILLTVMVSIATTPLTWMAMRAQSSMTRLQPELNRLRRMYKDDPEKLRAETAALFQAAGVSPLTGCLAPLLQAPLFLSMYQVLRGLTYRLPGSGVFQPRHVGHGTTLYRALQRANTMSFLGVDLSQAGAAALHAWPAPGFLCLLVTGVAIYAAFRLQSREQTRGAQRLARLAPAALAVSGLLLPLVVTLYYATASLVRLGQHRIMARFT
jgi:YidC/Oxa1 family membrane protein insertase